LQKQKLKAKKRQGCRFFAAQGIAAESPEQTAWAVCEDLERKARFPAKPEMRPDYKKS
jgi:hypothetical protein